jgi:cytosine/adenosine deaminase-related metal-dependent hydrolase
MSSQLFKMIKDFHISFPGIYSIHNQETKSEDQLYIDRSGELYDLFTGMGWNLSAIEKTGKTSLQSIIPFFPENTNVLLVHNIYLSPEDIDVAIAALKMPYFVFCPNSNLIIEHRLPNIKMLIEKNAAITIGTDSYSSNKRLSILEELKTISSHFQDIDLKDILKWATWNGASALGIENRFGSFEIGKNPGVNLITGIDFENMKLTQDSKIKVLA